MSTNRAVFVPITEVSVIEVGHMLWILSNCPLGSYYLAGIQANHYTVLVMPKFQRPISTAIFIELAGISGLSSFGLRTLSIVRVERFDYNSCDADLNN